CKAPIGWMKNERKEEYRMISKKDVVIYDAAGIPSIMVEFKKERNSDLFPGGSEQTHPAFIIDGEEVDSIYIAKYECTMIHGKPYSLPYTVPKTNITYDDAMQSCYRKGTGWHMMTAAEWGLVTLDSSRNGTLPHGNTAFGEYFEDPKEHGVDSGRFDITLTGSGPETWSHDHTVQGVYDLCGNVWEYVAGLRLLDGEIQIIENNDVAKPVDSGANSALWKPILHKGTPLRFTVGKHGLHLSADHEQKEDRQYSSCNIGKLKLDIDTPELLQALAIHSENDQVNRAGLWVDTKLERLPVRGAGWHYGACAGVAALGLNFARSYSSCSIGFRSAYFGKL
ncbi:MAG: hypothetical protein RR053_07105, partial [Evtepia sp.]